jgi:hypothetical protein
VNDLPLPAVSADDLPDRVRQTLTPGASLTDVRGNSRTLPSSFLRIDSWSQALEMPLSPHFMLWELIDCDVREAPEIRAFPRYVPCALLLLASALEVFRVEVGTYVHIAANGGYRSPGHSLSRNASRHCWGTAANIYRIGDTYLESRSEIDRFAAIARRVLPGAWIRPFGPDDGEADDHLHLDIGYTVFDPPELDGITT